jgi:hypothetical protein
MNDDDFSVTMKSSLQRREAWPLVIEGYRLIARATAEHGCRLFARMRLGRFLFARRRSSRDS